MTGKKQKIHRRAFVQAGAGAASATLLPTIATAQDEAEDSSKKPKMKTRKLGKTKLEVPEVSFGTWGFSNSALLEEALDKGIRLICTAAEYQNGVAEEAIGKVMKKRRKDAILFTGWKCKAETKKDDLLKQLDGSLKRLQTDRIDIIKSHFIEKPEELDNDAQFEAFEEAKAAGKVRVFGISCHTGNLEKIVQKALKIESIQVIQCKYNFMEYPSQMKLFEAAHKKGGGGVAFKVGAGKREDEIKSLAEKGLSLRQATIRWALANKHVSSVCMGISNFSQIEEFQGAAMKKLGQADVELLNRYAKAVDTSYCRYCSTCEPHCPKNVAVADIMRYSMYFKYYKIEKEAMRLYGGMAPEIRADACDTCGGACERGCPHGRAVRDGLLEAREILT